MLAGLVAPIGVSTQAIFTPTHTITTGMAIFIAVMAIATVAAAIYENRKDK